MLREVDNYGRNNLAQTLEGKSGPHWKKPKLSPWEEGEE